MPDPARAHLVVRMFELYATGNYSIRTLAEEMKKLGLRTTLKNAKPLTIGMIHSTLQNPFYYGMMRVKNELYPHKYQKLISEELFNKVQQIRLGYHQKPFKYAGKPFVLRGLVKCADEQCGCTITAETHKGHNYYSCMNYKRIHPKRVYVREEDLLSPINEALKNIRLSGEKIQEITDELKKSNLAKNEFHKQSLVTLRKEYDLYQKRIDVAFDPMTDGSITKDMFNKKLKF
ncbi:MAG: recombinase family protein [candidate division WOR-3 bacterium]|nr:recombinase family protein [candidate division WOR-3 bacterium]